jgi:glycine/D-amino acid oxidase-like deaminating enzyme
MAPSSKDAPINIIGAGIFGLSTALHLARRGYRNVTVFDKQPYDATRYSYFEGCDAASAGTRALPLWSGNKMCGEVKSPVGLGSISYQVTFG